VTIPGLCDLPPTIRLGFDAAVLWLLYFALHQTRRLHYCQITNTSLLKLVEKQREKP
jgi:hypothetical protein